MTDPEKFLDRVRVTVAEVVREQSSADAGDRAEVLAAIAAVQAEQERQRQDIQDQRGDIQNLTDTIDRYNGLRARIEDLEQQGPLGAVVRALVGTRTGWAILGVAVLLIALGFAYLITHIPLVLTILRAIP